MKKILTTLVVATALVTACKKDKTPPTAPTVTTSPLTNITTSSATAGGVITSNGGATVTASGIVLSKKNSTPTLTDTVISSTATSGSFTVNLTNLDFGTTYNIRAYATNSVGTSYGDVVTLNTTNDDTKVRFTYNGQTVIYGVITSPTTGKKWMDRNLGASAVATSLTDTSGYGDLFEWGRLADGHQLRTAGKTTTASSTDVPGHSNFIYGNEIPPGTGSYDWRIPQNNNLWQGSTGINNPCPSGWHVPKKTEWDAETGIIDPNTAFTILKLPLSGYRSHISGNVNAGSLGTQGHYWSATIDPNSPSVFEMSVYPGNTRTATIDRDLGESVRCIKD